MPIARTALIFTIAGFALSACAYAPERTEPRWTDAQLQTAPPGEAPGYIPEERIEPIVFFGYVAQQRILAGQRDQLQEDAAQIPESDGQAEDFAAEARDRATPPDPQ